MDFSYCFSRNRMRYTPKFHNYDAIIMNYNGPNWSRKTERDLEKYISEGGGMILFHSASNSFPNWVAFNHMIGFGGWNGRDEKSGPRFHYQNNDLIYDNSPGIAGYHGNIHDFIVKTKDPSHPIMDGLPKEWLHSKDELYENLRGPGKNMTILASAESDPKYGGLGQEVPVVAVLEYGCGKIFHTTMGHCKMISLSNAMLCIGFQELMARGIKWVIGDNSLSPIPKNHPTKLKTSTKNWRSILK